MTKALLITSGILFLALSALSWFTWDLHAKYVTEKNNAKTYLLAKQDFERKVIKANETSQEYQKQLNIVDRDLADLRLQYKPRDCVNIVKPQRRPTSPATGNVIFDGNEERGLSPDWLFDFAGRCEKTRQKVIGLQNFYKVNQ